MRQLVQRVIVPVGVVAALALPAFATEAPQFYDSKLTLNAESKNGGPYNLNRSLQLKVRYDNLTKESGGSTWRLDAELGSFLKWDGGDDLKVGKYRLMVTDPRLKLAIWGNGFEYETKEIPFGHITSQKAAPRQTARLTYGPFTADLRLENDWEKTTLIYDHALGHLTAGIGVQHQNRIKPGDPASHIDIFGAYLKGDLTPRLKGTEIAVYTRSGTHADVTGAKAGGQYRFAAKTEIPIVNRWSTELETSYHPENWGNDSRVVATLIHDHPSIGEIKLEGMHRFYTSKPIGASSNTRQQRIGLSVERDDYLFESEYSQEPGFSDLNKREVFADFRWRGSKAIKFEDLFKTDKYRENTAMAYGVRYETLLENKKSNPGEDPTNTVTLNAGGRLQPGGRVWALATAIVQTDRDGKDWKVKDAANSDQTLGKGAESKMGMSIEGRVRYFADLRHVWITPWARYGSGKEGAHGNSLMAAGVDLEYEVDKLTYTLALSGGSTNINGVQASQSRVLAGAILEF